MSETTNLVEVRDLVKRYGRTLAVDGISLDIARGERYAILGPNGAGKTTLIHVLCTIHRADSGTAVVDGFEVHKQPRLARRRIGVVFQEPSVDTRLTVEENLEFHGRVYGVPGRLRRQRIKELLELVELSDWRSHLVRALSRGMQRRLEIARALVHDAALLVLDEPTVGLDAQTRGRMWTYLEDLQNLRDLTVLVTTHYIEEVDGCDRVCVVDHGKVLTTGSPEELKANHGTWQIRLVAADAETDAALAAAHPHATREGADLLVPIADEREVEPILAAFGGKLRAFAVERPTLESVFLDLTGRELRDAAAGARDRMLTAPRSGGEPVR
ncbi:MAG: ATP-binding cassette domain-containing protein [Trueperaceae bacterium]